MKIKKIILLILLTSLTLFNCANSKSENRKRVRYIHELLDGDNKEFYGCSLLIKMGKWEEYQNGIDGWGRDISLRYNNGTTQLETGETIYNKDGYLNSIKIQDNPKYALVYIGKWHHIERLGVDIRLVGYQIINDKNYIKGELMHLFESKNKENEKIKEMKFSPVARIPNLATSGRAECAIKWYNRYGYNAIAETKGAWYPGFWGKILLQRQLIITGKVIQAEE